MRHLRAPLEVRAVLALTPLLVALCSLQSHEATVTFLDHPFKAGRFSSKCGVQLARYPCPYPPEDQIGRAHV